MATIYAQLGGEKGMKGLVDSFVQRVQADSSLSPPTGPELDTLVDVLTAVTGGPSKGALAADTRLDLGGSGGNEAIAGHLIAELRARSVPPQVVDQIRTIVSPTTAARAGRDRHPIGVRTSINRRGC